MFLKNVQGSGISAWDFWGFIFGRGIFGYCALLGMVWVLVFLPICSSPSLGIRSTPSPLDIQTFIRDHLSEANTPGGGGGYSHTLPIRVCAAQRGRDFEAPDLERGIHFRGVF